MCSNFFERRFIKAEFEGGRRWFEFEIVIMEIFKKWNRHEAIEIPTQCLS